MEDKIVIVSNGKDGGATLQHVREAGERGLLSAGGRLLSHSTTRA